MTNWNLENDTNDCVKDQKEENPDKKNVLNSLLGDDYNYVILGRNGAGKTSSSERLYREKNPEKGTAIKDVFIFSRATKASDYFLNFEDGLPLIPFNSDEIEDRLDKIREINSEISSFARKVARYGGSNANPDGTLARRLYSFNITGASFNRILKERFTGNGLAYLKQIVDSGLYQEKLPDFKENPDKYNESEKETLKLLKELDDRHNLKAKTEEFEKLDEERKKIEEALQKGDQDYLKKLQENLSIILFDNSRLSLAWDGEEYKVVSRGNVLDKAVASSTAEQNILSLVHFFVRLEMEIDSYDSEPKKVTIVLDDPISSTDSENKIGIFTFLRTILSTLSKKILTNVIVLTHSEEIFYHASKLMEDLGEKNLRYKELRQESHELENIQKDSHFYSSHLFDIFLFANGYKQELSPYIGNIMRKVLEAYSTFNYGVGIDKLTRDDEIRSRLGNENNFWGNHMYRLLVNSDSHSKEKLKMTSPEGYSLFDTEEKKKTAQFVLALLYNFDAIHVEKHLKSQINKEKIEKELESKEKEIYKKKKELANLKKAKQTNEIDEKIQNCSKELKKIHYEKELFDIQYKIYKDKGLESIIKSWEII